MTAARMMKRISIMAAREYSPAAVQRNDERPAIAAPRGGIGEGDPDLVESALENVLAMTGRVHPSIHHRLAVAVSEGQVLADHPIAVAAGLDPGERVHAVGRHVIEVAFGKHVPNPIFSGEVEARLQL